MVGGRHPLAVSARASVLSRSVGKIPFVSKRPGRRLAVWGVLASAALGAVALTASTAARADDVVITENARTHFAAGVALLKDPSGPRYEAAYLEFKTAYAASPSYKILGNFGLCAMQIERDLEAIQAYEEYLKQGGADIGPTERAQIERDLLTLKAGLVRVSVSSDPPGATITDVRIPVKGSEIRNVYEGQQAPLELGLRRGRHVLTAKLEGFHETEWELGPSDDAPPPHIFKMVPLAPTTPVVTPIAPPPPVEPMKQVEPLVRQRPTPRTAYVAGGVGVGLLLTGTIFGIEALQKHSDYDKLNNGLDVSSATSTRNTGVMLNAIADGCFAGALASAVVAAYIFVARPTVERPAAQRLQIAPTWAGRGPGASAVWIFQ